MPCRELMSSAFCFTLARVDVGSPSSPPPPPCVGAFSRTVRSVFCLFFGGSLFSAEIRVFARFSLARAFANDWVRLYECAFVVVLLMNHVPWFLERLGEGETRQGQKTDQFRFPSNVPFLPAGWWRPRRRRQLLPVRFGVIDRTVAITAFSAACCQRKESHVVVRA